LESTAPQAELHPVMLQATAVELVPVTVAVNCWVAPAPSETEPGDIEIFTATWFTFAEPVFEVSDCNVATTVTVASLGTGVGAVYRPLVSIVPQAEPVHPEVLHVTAVDEVPVTVAVNCWVAPAMSETVLGDTETDISGGGFFPPQPERIETSNKAADSKV
jgi:hypothetical protein